MIHTFKHRLYISALEQVRFVLLGKYVLLEAINTVYSDFVKYRGKFNFFDQGLCVSALEHVMKFILCSCVLLVFIN